jgi:hypothetical protein
MIKKIMLAMVLLVSLANAQFQDFKQFQKTQNWADAQGIFGIVPLDNLNLLVHPAYTLGVADNPSSLGTEVLGSNLISNGDFHDFTMEDDANSIGHYIFTDYSAEDDNNFMGSERSGSEVVKANPDMVTDSDSDGVTDGLAIPTITSSLGSDSDGNYQLVTGDGVTNMSINIITGTLTSGKTYKIDIWYKNNLNSSAYLNANPYEALGTLSLKTELTKVTTYYTPAANKDYIYIYRSSPTGNFSVIQGRCY